MSGSLCAIPLWQSIQVFSPLARYCSCGGDAITHRRAGQLLERTAELKVELGLFGFFDEHAGSHQCASDTSDEGVE